MRTCLLILMGFLLGSYAAFADEVKAVTPSIRVCLNVSIDKSDPAVLENTARSYLTREFRTIPDIKLVEIGSPNDVYIDCFPMELRNVNGTLTGYVISTAVVDRSLNEKAMNAALVSDMGQVDKNLVMHYLYNFDTGKMQIHELTVCGPDQLQKSCSDIVATLDGGVIESIRSNLSNRN